MLCGRVLLCSLLLASAYESAVEVGHEAAHPQEVAPRKAARTARGRGSFRFKPFGRHGRSGPELSVPVRSLAAHPDFVRATNLLSGLLLLCSGPLALRGGVSGSSKLQAVLLGGWVSMFGAMIMLQELQLPRGCGAAQLKSFKRWLRRNFRFLATSGGRLLFCSCAATMAVVSGPHGRVPAAATLAAGWYSSLARRKHGRPVTAGAPHSAAAAAAALRIDHPHSAAAPGKEEGAEPRRGGGGESSQAAGVAGLDASGRRVGAPSQQEP